MAGGAGLLAACDFAVAADDLRIGFPEVRRGLVPAVVATVLRRKLAEADLRELLLLAEPIDAGAGPGDGTRPSGRPGRSARSRGRARSPT